MFNLLTKENLKSLMLKVQLIDNPYKYTKILKCKIKVVKIIHEQLEIYFLILSIP